MGTKRRESLSIVLRWTKPLGPRWIAWWGAMEPRRVTPPHGRTGAVSWRQLVLETKRGKDQCEDTFVLTVQCPLELRFPMQTTVNSPQIITNMAADVLPPGVTRSAARTARHNLVEFYIPLMWSHLTPHRQGARSSATML